MTTKAIVFLFLVGVGFAALVWMAIKAPRSWIKVLGCLLAMVVVLVIGAIGLLGLVKPRQTSSKSSCIANLKQIQGAKATWALEYKKPESAIPEDSDLFGENMETHYIRRKPKCPMGGTYTLGAVTNMPTCSIGTDQHVLNQSW